jgi:hypothetical protein
VIRWNDFVLDDVFGALLVSCDEESSVLKASVMDDARDAQIQETGQEIVPARMVGQSSSESMRPAHMDVRPGVHSTKLQQGGEA